MGLHCTQVDTDCPFDVAGFTFAGFPGVIIGHNTSIAWGFTNLDPDVTDLYLEAVRGERYRRGGSWKRFDRREETIGIAGEEPFTYTVRSTVHGPLLSDVAPEYASVGANAPVPAGSPKRRTGYAVALAWTALTPNRTADAVFEIDQASDWEGFRDAARDFAAPSQNMVYADTAGHIGYQAPGLIPLRGPAHDGAWPAPGWDRAYDWTANYIPFDALPSVLDPDDGFLVTANQAVVGPGYPYHLGDSWSAGYRSQRITDVLAKKGTLSAEDMSRLQLDTRNGFAPRLVPYLLEVDAGSRYYSAGQRLLRSWDFTQPPESAPAAYFNAVWRNLLTLTFHDELPADVPVSGDDRWFEVVSRLLDQPGNPWWDDVATDGVREGRDDILRTAVRDARDELVRLQSRRPDNWTWGHQHTLELENQSLGQSGIGLVERLLNRGPWQLGGGNGMVDATAWDAEEGYEVTAVPSMRMVVSLADLDESTWVNLTGASGHPFDAHYTDQTELWAEGETLTWPFTRAAVTDAEDDRLVLRPAAS
jgi:penicillin amidase